MEGFLTVPHFPSLEYFGFRVRVRVRVRARVRVRVRVRVRAIFCLDPKPGKFDSVR